MSGLLKTGLKTALIEALYNEVVSNTNNYYYFIGRPLEWDTEDAENIPSPEDTMAFENGVRNEMIFFKKVSPGDIAYTINRYDWQANTVFDMYDDQLGKSLMVSGCVGGSGVERIVITTQPWTSEMVVTIGDVIEYDNRVYKVVAGSDGEDLGLDLNLSTIPPTHTSGTQLNGEAELRFTGYDFFDPSIIEIGMSVSAPGIAAGARVIGVEGDTVTLSAPNVGNVNGDVEFTIVSPSYTESLQDSKFYCITTDFNVYKCLDNNGGAPSTVKPFATTHEPIKLADGYVWKYLYTIPRYLVNKFLTPAEIPVTTALKNQYYSRGSIAQVVIVNGGTGYDAGTELEVVGDGHIEGNVYRILRADVSSLGSGYNSTPTIVVEDPYENVIFSPNTDYIAGQYVKVLETDKIYQVVAPGVSGSTAPDHTSLEPIYNGSVSFKFVGLTTQATANVVDGTIQSVDTTGIVGFVTVTTPGYGYTSAPQVILTSIDSGVGAEAVAELTYNPLSTSSTLWGATAVVQVGDIIRYSDRLYKVSAGTDGPDDGTDVNLGPTPPTHIEGTESNGEVSLTFIGRIPSISVGRISNIILTNRGGNYTSPPLVGIEPPIPEDDVSIWTSGGTVSVGDILRTNGNYYRVVYETGVLGSSPPTHTSGIQPNGDNVDLEFVAQQAIASAEIYKGFGYNKIPSVQIESPIQAGIDVWSPFKLVDGGDIIRHNTIYYEVDGSDTGIELGEFAPTHSVGSDTNGDATLNVVSRLVQWFPALLVNGGDYVQHQGFFYQVDGSDTELSLGLTPPFHQEGIETNGTADLEFIGQQATVGVATEKTKARVAPIIDIATGQIVGVVIVDGGVGYTTASIRISSQTGVGAELIVDTSFGDLDSKQANIELLAVPGSIDAIRIVNPGAGYASAQVAVTGDGSGCTAEAVLSDGGSIEKIIVTNPGIGYTKATVEITGSGTFITQAFARAIVSPPAGHGRNAIRELAARNLTIATSIAADKNQGFEVLNDYTQVGLLKNPQQFSTTLFATSSRGSACYSVSGNFSYPDIAIDDVLADDEGNRFRVVAKPRLSPSESIWPLLIQDLDNTAPVAGEPLTKLNTEDVIVAVVSNVTLPTVDKYSGDLLFVDNLFPFEPTDQQTISLKTTIKL